MDIKVLAVMDEFREVWVRFHAGQKQDLCDLLITKYFVELFYPGTIYFRAD